MLFDVSIKKSASYKGGKTQNQMKKKPNWKIRLAAAVLGLALISLGKLAIYEFSGAAPKLREAIGSEVRLPDSVLGASALLDPKPVVVESVRYRWNDKVGFFDLSLKYDQGGTGLSPFEAMKISVVKGSDAETTKSEQAGAGKPATRAVIEPEGGDKP